MGATAAIAGIAGSAASIGSTIAGATSGSPSATSGPAPSVYQPQNEAAIDQSFFNQFNQQSKNNPYNYYSPYMLPAFNAQVSNPYAAGYQNAAATEGYYGTQLGGAGQTTGLTGLNLSNSMLPYASNIFQNAWQNPYAQQAQAGANQAGTMGAALGSDLVAEANALPGQAQALYGALPGYAQSTLNTAFDPQGTLYAQQFQQNLDQTRAGLAARGLDTSGVGQGIENQSNLNFNTNWQNQQLARQTQGLTAYENAVAPVWSSTLGALQNQSAIGGQGIQDYLTGTQLPYQTALGQSQALAGIYGQLGQGSSLYGNLGTGAYNLGAAGTQGVMNAQGLPYNTYNTIAQQPWTAISNYQQASAGAQNQQQQLLADALQYMQLGPSAGTAALNSFNANNAYQQQQFQGLGQFAQAVPGLVNNAGNAYNSLFGPSASANYNYTAPYNFSDSISSGYGL